MTGREVRHPHLADESRPQADDAEDPPVADADEPEREREAREADERPSRRRRHSREQREGRDEVRGDRRPDEVRPTDLVVSEEGKGFWPWRRSFASG